MGNVQSKPIVSIVLVSYNDERLLSQCLKSIESQTFKAFEVILVDNGSKDRSVEVAKEAYPGIKVVMLDRNYGLTAAYNVGLRLAKGRYIATLHNDVILDKLWLEALVRAIDENPEYVLLGSVEATPEIPYHTYVDMNPWFSYVRYRSDEGREVVPTVYVSGTSLFFKRELLERLVTVFSPILGTYAYDDEISFKTFLSLGQVGYSTRSLLYHYGGGTAGKVVTVKRAAYLRSRNRVLVLFECLGIKTFIKALLVLLMLELSRLFTRTKDFLGNIYTFSGMLSGIALLPTVLDGRKNFQRLKIKDDATVMDRLRARTKFQRLIKIFLSN